MRFAIELVMYKVELSGCLENYDSYHFQLDKRLTRGGVTPVTGLQASISGQGSEDGYDLFSCVNICD
jgi:hypothetical protein